MPMCACKCKLTFMIITLVERCSQACAKVLVRVCRYTCTHTHTHKKCILILYPCFSNLGDLCLEYCSVLGGILGNSQPYVPLFVLNCLTLGHIPMNTMNTNYITVMYTGLQTHTCTSYFQPKGQGQKKSPCRFGSLRGRG